ncbi:MAG: DUF3048 domain-containing protein [Eubacterium sp.]
MKKFIAVIISLVLALTLFGCSAKEEPTTAATTTTETTTAPPPVVNPLTGEDGYNKSAVGIRPVSIVVENTKPARPQWGITTPDIIIEGEVEGGISRMLWLYADYTAVPEKVGPLRSARPSFIKFSELFDSIYVHWGGSHSKKSAGYTGGYETIKADGVDDIDGMNGGELFGRDSTRSVSSEHRGIMKGDKLPAAIEKKGYRTKVDNDSFTQFSFNEEIKNAGADSAVKVNITFSSRTDTRKFTYSTDDKLYHTSDWDEDVSFENLIILMDSTTYITTPYKNSTTTYLNYSLKSGSGYLVSNGTKTAIKWDASSGVLKLTDDSGNAVSLNPGKSYIALGSSNHEGKVSFTSASEE